MKIREDRIIFYVPAVLANIQLDVMPLTFHGFLKNTFATRRTLHATSEFGVRESIVASAAHVAYCGSDASDRPSTDAVSAQSGCGYRAP